jgi:hypothetical protein
MTPRYSDWVVRQSVGSGGEVPAEAGAANGAEGVVGTTAVSRRAVDHASATEHAAGGT